MNTVELVIFDIDGLCLNTEYFWHQAWFETSRKHHLPAMYRVYCNMTGLSREDTDNAMRTNFPNLAEREEIMAEARAYGRELMEQGLRTMPGLENVLDLLDDLGIRRVVATNTSRALTEERLTKMHLLHRFDDMICGDEVVHRKPDPEIYFKALAKTGVKPENALVLEDTGYGVRAAHGAGIPVIMVPSLKNPDEEERAMALQVVPSLYSVVRYLLSLKEKEEESLPLPNQA